MKRLFYICLLFVFGCTDDFSLDENKLLNEDLHNIENSLQVALQVCNKKTMPWLSEMLQKAEEDRIYKKHNGQFIGRISVVQYKGNIYFLTTFSMGSGGFFFYLFDCNGIQQQSLLESDELVVFFYTNSLKRNLIIYSTTNI